MEHRVNIPTSTVVQPEKDWDPGGMKKGRRKGENIKKRDGKVESRKRELAGGRERFKTQRGEA